MDADFSGHDDADWQGPRLPAVDVDPPEEPQRLTDEETGAGTLA